MRLRHVLVAGPMMFACGVDYRPPATAAMPTLPDLTIPPAPDPGKGFQIITPIFDGVEPSKDYEVCTWSDVILDHDIDIRSTQGYQNEPPGHHIILFYTNVRQPAGTQRICSDSDMATFRFLGGAGGEGLVNTAPGNLVFHIPAGSQIVMNHHYLNSTDQMLSGQSVINAYYADPSQQWTHNGYTAVVNTGLVVPEGPSAQDMHAVLDRTYKMWGMIPHMHQWGTHETIKITKAGQQQTMFDLDWDPSYTFHPPEQNWDPTTPMTLNPGDAIDVHCAWNNTSGRVLTFGFEMCVMFAFDVDDTNQGSWAWDNGNWGSF